MHGIITRHRTYFPFRIFAIFCLFSALDVAFEFDRREDTALIFAADAGCDDCNIAATSARNSAGVLGGTICACRVSINQ